MYVVPSMEVTQALEDLVAVESHIILRQGPCNMELLTQGACTGHTGLSYACTHTITHMHTCTHPLPTLCMTNKQVDQGPIRTYISCLKAVECAYVTNDGNIQIPHQTGLLSPATQASKPSDLNNNHTKDQW